MSYDIRICVKVADADDLYAVVATPEYDSPTYNLGEMFRRAMNWDFVTCRKDEDGEYHQVYYRCEDILQNVERGIRELRTKRSTYEKYEPDNGWGAIESAIKALESLRNCIYETSACIPISNLYMRWT